jgi:hypothetical protein
MMRLRSPAVYCGRIPRSNGFFLFEKFVWQNNWLVKAIFVPFRFLSKMYLPDLYYSDHMFVLFLIFNWIKLRNGHRIGVAIFFRQLFDRRREMITSERLKGRRLAN